MIDTNILKYLSDSPGFLSGQSLAEKLNVTRTAVWKRIGKLRREGFSIVSSPRKGYRLVSVPDKLLPPLVHLGLHTSRIGREIFYYPQIDSTNRRAKLLASQAVPDGTIVLAEHQTHGQGRLKREWISPVGKNLLFSIIFYPSVPPPQVFLLTLLTSLSVCKTLITTTQISAGIKWPNDVYVNNRKICGVLTEFSANQDRANWAVVGIGLNVNFDPSSDPQIAAVATSVMTETGVRHDRLLLLRNVLEKIEYYYDRFLTGDVATLRDEWISHSIVIGKPVTIISGDHREDGVAETIDEDGALILRTAEGTLKRIIYGDLSLRIKQE